MFNVGSEKLKELGADITAIEIKQQPELWEEAFTYYKENQERISHFLTELTNHHQGIRVIFTGAGTSAYVGDTILPYLNGKVNEKTWNLMSIPTTDLVSNPTEFFKTDIPTLLVSFARSGNSPESTAAVELGQKLVKDFYQLTITCAPEGKLAQNAQGDAKNLLLMMPKRANDKGFAMTGSYSCMALTTLLVFDPASDEKKEQFVQAMITMGTEVIAREADIKKIVDLDFNRVVYLGSGSLAGMSREASLKLLELTAGKVATLFDSSMGFRHGPKSFVDHKTLVVGFASNEEYTRKYDLDVLNEVYHDQIAEHVCCLTVAKKTEFDGESFILNEIGKEIPDAYLALPYVMFAQVISIMTSLKVGNKPDTPSPTGTVNRVVKGVKIYPYK